MIDFLSLDEYGIIELPEKAFSKAKIGNTTDFMLAATRYIQLQIQDYFHMELDVIKMLEKEGMHEELHERLFAWFPDFWRTRFSDSELLRYISNAAIMIADKNVYADVEPILSVIAYTITDSWVSILYDDNTFKKLELSDSTNWGIETNDNQRSEQSEILKQLASYCETLEVDDEAPEFYVLDTCKRLANNDVSVVDELFDEEEDFFYDALADYVDIYIKSGGNQEGYCEDLGIELPKYVLLMDDDTKTRYESFQKQFNVIGMLSKNALSDMLFKSLIMLQCNANSPRLSEDQLNDHIKEYLTIAGYQVHDQPNN